MGQVISAYTRCFEYGAPLTINMDETQLDMLRNAQNKAESYIVIDIPK